MLKQQLEKLDFYKGVKFEVKGKQLFARSKDRTSLQEQTEKYFKRNRILFNPRKKITELDVTGASQVLVFKPMAAKGAGGLKFEDQIVADLNNWLKGADYDELKHPDTIQQLVKTIRLKQDSSYYVKGVGSENTRRPPTFTKTKATVTNNVKGKVSDVNIYNKSNRVLHHLSLKFSNSFYIYNATVINYFRSPTASVRTMINEFFGFDGVKMGKAFGKEYAAKTPKNYNYSSILTRFRDLLIQCLGPDIVLVLKVGPGNNHIDNIKGFGHKISLSGLTKDSYGYAETGVRKYNFIRFRAVVNGHNYEIDFQFRGTTSTDTGPRYLRILFKAK
tara:strand:+ start:1529 stop:2524 length:996 start_codon:yes stop_codon:yes gene_type:complete